mgnify:CR=1 FL=1
MGELWVLFLHWKRRSPFFIIKCSVVVCGYTICAIIYIPFIFHLPYFFCFFTLRVLLGDAFFFRFFLVFLPPCFIVVVSFSCISPVPHTFTNVLSANPVGFTVVGLGLSICHGGENVVACFIALLSS